jgi:hypothetical protein
MRAVGEAARGLGEGWPRLPARAPWGPRRLLADSGPNTTSIKHFPPELYDGSTYWAGWGTLSVVSAVHFLNTEYKTPSWPTHSGENAAVEG